MLKAIYAGSPFGCLESKIRRDEIFQIVLLWLRNNSNCATERHAEAISNIVLGEWSSLSQKSLNESCNLFIETFKEKWIPHPKFYEFLPKLIYQLSDVESQTKVEGMYSIAYKEYFIEKIISSHWSPSAAVPIVTMFREIELPDYQVKRMANKAIRYVF